MAKKIVEGEVVGESKSSETVDKSVEKAKDAGKTFVKSSKNIFQHQKDFFTGLDKTSKIVLIINIVIIAIVVFLIGVSVGEERREKEYRDALEDAFDDFDYSNYFDSEQN